MRHVFRSSVFALLVAMVSVNRGLASDGDLDPAFGTAGIAGVMDPAISYRVVPRIATQADGRILLCAATGGSSIHDFLLIRLSVDGSVDTSFGTNGNGQVAVDIGASGDEDACAAVVVQADGRIVATGWTRTPDRVAVLRLTSNGALDASFGGGTGRMAFSFGNGTSLAEAKAVALQPDGRIVVAGSYRASDGGKVFAVARLIGDGTLDASFALSGRVSIDFGAGVGDAAASAIAIDASGRIVIGGTADFGGNVDFALARLLPDGQLDATFSGDGRARLGFDLGGGNVDSAFSLVLQDGRVVMAGSASQGNGSDMAVARFVADGSPDPSFGIGGKTVVPFDLVSDGNDSASALVAQPNGRLLIAGAAAAGPDFHNVAAIARLRNDGSLDNQFGAFGKAWFDLDSTLIFSDVALQGPRIVACGLGASAFSVNLVSVAGLENDLVFAHGFGP